MTKRGAGYGGRPAGVVANEILCIFDWRNPAPLTSIPDNANSRAQLQILFDDLAQIGDVSRMRSIAANLAPWLQPEDLEAMIADCCRAQRRWILEHELVQLAETFQVSECDRVGLRLRQIRPVHSDGKGFSAQDMLSRRREANRLAQQDRRRRDAEQLKERSATDAEDAKLSEREALIYEKITAAWRSTAEIARAVRRTHGYEGTRDLASIGKAVNRASERLVFLRLVERDPSRKGTNGQPLNYFRRMIVHGENVFETSRHAENGAKNQVTDRLG